MHARALRLCPSLITALAAGMAAMVHLGDAHAAAPPAPPSNVRAVDHSWDGGKKIDLTWELSPDDATVSAYEVLKSVATIDGRAVPLKFSHVDFIARSRNSYTASDLRPTMDRWEIAKDYGASINIDELTASGEIDFSVGYVFQVIAVGADNKSSAPAQTASALEPTVQSFDGDRLWLAIITLVVCGSVVTFIVLARRGMPMRVRTIAGLAAVDEAVGRATEMGRPILFVAGTQDMNDIQTIAGLTVLARVAKTAAEYDAKVEVPTSRSLVMTAARETVHAAYLAAGRPDAYNQDLIYYVTDEQFGFVAYLQGMMVREKPAACFYLGTFFAESLILAETGNGIGAIQIAGTAQPAQLPFFVAACDYTLIGEEFYAASAYLSGEADQLGSLKGQDVGKIIVAAFLVVGCILATIVAITGSPNITRVLDFIRGTMLT